MQAGMKIIENNVFELIQKQHPKNPQLTFYHFRMHTLTEARQEYIDLLSESLAVICNNTVEMKSSVILDCSALKNLDLIRRLWRLSFKRALSINNTGLDKFLLVSTSRLANSFSTGIIRLKKAGDYAKICNSLEEAIQSL